MLLLLIRRRILNIASPSILPRSTMIFHYAQGYDTSHTLRYQHTVSNLCENTGSDDFPSFVPDLIVFGDLFTSERIFWRLRSA